MQHLVIAPSLGGKKSMGAGVLLLGQSRTLLPPALETMLPTVRMGLTTSAYLV